MSTRILIDMTIKLSNGDTIDVSPVGGNIRDAVINELPEYTEEAELVSLTVKVGD